jgi:superfamily II DNA/RNA helicase
MSSLESLRSPKCRSIVVASDVAARGLDIPSVATVVHYDVARSIDTFIHRSGRTAVSVSHCQQVTIRTISAYQVLAVMIYLD